MIYLLLAAVWFHWWLGVWFVLRAIEKHDRRSRIAHEALAIAILQEIRKEPLHEDGKD